jgi:protein AroM
MKQIVLLTIGRSPRPDIRRDVERGIGAGVSLLERGALDAVSDEQAHALKPETNDDALIASLGSQGQAVVSKKAIGHLLQKEIEVLEAKVDGFAILCTGVFAGLASRKPIGQVGQLMLDAGAACAGRGPIGVLMPIEEQRALNRRVWSANGRPVEAAVASPYQGLESVLAAAIDLSERGAEVIVLSCMTYSEDMRAAIAAATRKPTIGPSQVLVDFISKE